MTKKTLHTLWRWGRKSKVLIDNIAWLYWNNKIDTAIVVAPKGVYTNWKNNEILCTSR